MVFIDIYGQAALLNYSDLNCRLALAFCPSEIKYNCYRPN